MIFYLILGTLFSIYACDLLFLVLVSFVARQHENVRSLIKSSKSAKSKQKQHQTDEGDQTNDEVQEEELPIPRDKHPKILIQLPMYNEEAHADFIIESCCKIKWPRDRLLIQVLDDSTKDPIKRKVDMAAMNAVENGHPIQVLRRTNRQGFKAGALVYGMEQVADEGYEYVAIFDADFEPAVDFLYETVVPLMQNPKLAFVQTCWTFTNANTFLTWTQQVNLNFHFEVEQRARSYLAWYFNFNGTAGIWRIRAIEDAGGWSSDTVVEDMDLSLRAYLKGWECLYLHHVKNPNELPSTLESFKTQQFRWCSGPMQIFSKCVRTIWTMQGSVWRKANCYWFFLRYLLFGLITLSVLVVPPCQLFLETWDWHWDQIFFLVSVNFVLAVYLYVTPFSIFYLLFSIVIGYFKLWGMIAGLIGSKKSKTWKVTKKTGAAGAGGARSFHRPYFLEMILFLYYAGMAGLSFWLVDYFMFGYCAIMAAAFLYVSFGDYLL